MVSSPELQFCTACLGKHFQRVTSNGSDIKLACHPAVHPCYPAGFKDKVSRAGMSVHARTKTRPVLGNPHFAGSVSTAGHLLSRDGQVSFESLRSIGSKCLINGWRDWPVNCSYNHAPRHHFEIVDPYQAFLRMAKRDEEITQLDIKCQHFFRI